MITPPPQVVLALGGRATSTVLFALVPGKLSVSVTLTSGDTFVFCKVIVSVEIPFGATVLGEKALLIEKSLTGRTVRSSLKGPSGARF